MNESAAATEIKPSPVREWRNVDAATFAKEIVALNEPAVLRGAANDWPLVRAWMERHEFEAAGR